ncbi:hypothetical protein [Flavobacterium sp.]|uniref:hypothetical protein n=1 Tax=Flavobacterium sp. TaxID=239 RepID=UPI003751EB52
MFATIQKYLLINYPLLWNTKIVPVVFYGLLFHIIFFTLGYFNGSIDFTESESNYGFNTNDGTIGFLCVLVTILSLIVWAVYYFKNNALKSFYPKGNFSLFKEWLLMLLGCIFLVTYMTTYFYGKDVRVRSYYSESDAKKRCETLSLGSYFVDGSYENYYNEYDNDNYESVTVDSAAVVDKNSTSFFNYQGKKYSYNSLINKNLNSYVFFNRDEDSINKNRIRNWLVNNEKDSVKTLFKNYLAIAKEHKLDASIDENKWLDLIYDYPTFEKYKLIGGEAMEVYYPNNNPGESNYDAEDQFLTTIKGTEYVVNKYYVPEQSLKFAYSKIADSYVKPIIGWETYLISLYVALGISLLLFSFRITSGKSWLIAVVSLGVLNIIIGILSAISSSEYVYLISILVVFLILLIYFFVILYNNKGKKMSAITINAMLWMLPAFGPIVYYLILQAAKEISGYNNYYGTINTENFPKINFLQDNGLLLMYLNYVLIIIIMLLLSKKFKQWRGVAES